MPTVTAIALETLLEPNSSTRSSGTNNAHHPSPKHYHHHPLRSTRREPSHSSSPSSSSSSPSSSSVGGTVAANNHRRPAVNSRRSNISKKGVAPPPAAGGGTASPAGRKPSPPVYHISPALYATPEPTRIAPASSPTFVSPSPYVLNHKRRAPPPPPPPPAQEAAGANNSTPAAPATSEEVGDHLNGSDITRRPPDQGDEIGPASSTDGYVGVLVGGALVGGEADGDGMREKEEEEEWVEENTPHDVECNGKGLAKEGSELDQVGHPDGVDEDDFFDPRELMSARSCSDTEDGSSFHHRFFGCNQTTPTSLSEFYDANEDFFSDGSVSHSSPSFRANVEADLRAVRLNLFDEIERRKKAEDTLDYMQNQFQRLVKQLARVGVSIPPIQVEGNVPSAVDSPMQVCQEVVVARFVSEAVERGLARAEAEAAAESVIESKNHEITRLRDRLQYYEAMNHEMSQRNQEAMELARRQRLKRKMRRRWIWSCIGLSVSVGASLLAHSYLPYFGKSTSATSSRCSAEDSSSETVESGGG